VTGLGVVSPEASVSVEVWDGLRWLEALGFHDFAGSTVVHGIGGSCALAGVIVVGARTGRFAEDGTPRMISGHSFPMVALGALLLWGGLFGFNAGSAMIADLNMGRIAVVTMIGGCFGALVALVLFWKMRGTPDPAITINGLVGGLVAVTAGADVINPASAAIIGMINRDCRDAWCGLAGTLAVGRRGWCCSRAPFQWNLGNNRCGALP
ncbi:MAG: hypothetical protein ACKVHP_16910, partial [Verrucomicrobiales bacterium]